MAEDKKDDKPKSKGSVLYDAPKGEPKRGSREAAAKKEGQEGSAKEERTEPATEAKKEGDKPKEGVTTGAKAETEMKAMEKEAKPVDDRKAMHSRHEAERRDFHNNHRESMRQMINRHEKEIRALNEKAEGVAQPAEMVPGNAPAVPQAQAPAAAAPTA